MTCMENAKKLTEVWLELISKFNQSQGKKSEEENHLYFCMTTTCPQKLIAKHQRKSDGRCTRWTHKQQNLLKFPKLEIT